MLAHRQAGRTHVSGLHEYHVGGTNAAYQKEEEEN
jgi:hypothetical protein